MSAMRVELDAIFGVANVSDDVAAHCGDRTENAPRTPSFVVSATRPEQVADLLRLANERKVPITPKVISERLIVDGSRPTASQWRASTSTRWP